MVTKVTQELLRAQFDYHPDGYLIRKPGRHRRSVQLKIGKEGHLSTDGYLKVMIQKKSYLAHRMIYLWHHGTLPDILDHIDRDRTNNKIENLRPCTRAQNLRNVNSRTGRFRNIQRARDRWRAKITINQKVIYVGMFGSPEDAATAVNFALARYSDEFAVYNEVPQPWLASLLSPVLDND